MEAVRQWIAGCYTYTFRRTTLLVVACTAFIGGTLVSPYSSVSISWLFLTLLFTPVIFKRGIAALLFCFAIGIIAGQLRGIADMSYEAPLASLTNQKIELIANVTENGVYDSRKRTAFAAETVAISSPYQADVVVPIRVSTFTANSVQRGDVVRVKGKLTQSLGNVVGVMNFADVEVVGKQSTWYISFSNAFEAGLRNALPEPQASFAAGLLIGQKSGLSDAWQEIIRDAGLMHIIAVSGYNLTILVAFARLALRRGSRYQVLVISLLFVSAFIAVTGLSPSIVRAAIVVLLLQVTWYFGRQIKPFVLISLAAAISAYIDPSQLWRSVGWYLSFAAFFGIIVLAPLWNRKMGQTLSTSLEIDRQPFRSLVTESVAALLMTAPIVVVIFGRFSTVSLLTNVVVAPLVPLAMFTSLIAGIAGMLVPALSGLIGLPARLVLTFMLDVANLATRIPGAAIDVSVPWHVACFIYLLIFIAALITYIYRRKRLHRTTVQTMVE